VPFPTGPADDIFCRLLLTHIAQPLDALRTLATQLRSGGLLLIEEVKWIRTTNPLFSDYLEIVGRMLADQGSNLHLGPILDRFEDSCGFRSSAGGVR